MSALPMTIEQLNDHFGTAHSRRIALPCVWIRDDGKVDVIHWDDARGRLDREGGTAGATLLRFIPPGELAAVVMHETAVRYRCWPFVVGQGFPDGNPPSITINRLSPERN